ALHQDQRLLYRVAKPVTTWGGQLEIISTHRGANTVFNDLIRDITERGNPMGWSHHKVTLADAVAAGLVEKIDAKIGSSTRTRPRTRTNDEPDPSSSSSTEKRRQAFLERTRAECLDQKQWLQEYCCVPADESTAFITFDMINSCETDCLKDFNYLLSCPNPL